MNVYVLGTGKDGAATDCYQSVLRSKLSAVWGSFNIQFHGEETAVFTPDECAALLIAGGNLPTMPQHLEGVLRYVTAMRWFSNSSMGVALGMDRVLSVESWHRYVPIIDSLKMVTVRDKESARILREAGVRSPVLTCADLTYLLPALPHVNYLNGKKPVLGVLSEWLNDKLHEALRDVKTDFEVRYISPADFAGIDVCLTNRLEGVILSVLHEIPFVTIPTPDDAIERECTALGYPALSDVRNAWSERVALQELLHNVKPRRLRLAARNIELMRAALGEASFKKPHPVGTGRETLVVWAAPDEYWDEAEGLLSDIGSGFDCLVPANCRVSPAGARRRMALPAGTLMHWGMLPADLRQQLENRYDNAVVCHAFNGSGTANHLADIAARTGRSGWEFRLWTHLCASYS